jgi:hypothetical protein
MRLLDLAMEDFPPTSLTPPSTTTAHGMLHPLLVNPLHLRKLIHLMLHSNIHHKVPTVVKIQLQILQRNRGEQQEDLEIWTLVHVKGKSIHPISKEKSLILKHEYLEEEVYKEVVYQLHRR